MIVEDQLSDSIPYDVPLDSRLASGSVKGILQAIHHRLGIGVALKNIRKR